MNIVIYSKNNCPDCKKAAKTLSGYNPKIIVVDKDISREDFFIKFPNVKQVPQVVINDQHIGGYDDLKTWLTFNNPNEGF